MIYNQFFKLIVSCFSSYCRVCGKEHTSTWRYWWRCKWYPSSTEDNENVSLKSKEWNVEIGEIAIQFNTYSNNNKYNNINYYELIFIMSNLND